MAKARDVLARLLRRWFEPDCGPDAEAVAPTPPQAPPAKEHTEDEHDSEVGVQTLVIEVLPVKSMHVLDCSDLHAAGVMCYGCQKLRCVASADRGPAWRCGRDGGEIRLAEIRPDSCGGYEGVECRS